MIGRYFCDVSVFIKGMLRQWVLWSCRYVLHDLFRQKKLYKKYRKGIHTIFVDFLPMIQKIPYHTFATHEVVPFKEFYILGPVLISLCPCTNLYLVGDLSFRSIHMLYLLPGP